MVEITPMGVLLSSITKILRLGEKKKEKKEEKKKTEKAMSFTRDLKNKEAASKPVHVSGREFADEGGHGVDSPHRDSRVFFLVETT